MGAVFALGFIFVLMVFAGGAVALAGLIMLIVRFIKKRRTMKKYRVIQILGIVFIVLGMGISLPPIALVGYMTVSTTSAVVKDTQYKKYYQEYIETDISIRVKDDTINETVCTLDTLKINGITYEKVDGPYVRFEDPDRGKAIANISDDADTLTVYEYSHSACDELIAVGDKIYAAPEQMAELIEYYNNCEFTYHYYHTYGEDSYKEFDFEMDDDVFLGLINYDEDYVKVDYGNNTRKNLCEFYVVQTSEDGRLKREFKVYSYSDGTLIVDKISNPLKRDVQKSDGEVNAADRYAISDAQTEKLFMPIAEDALAERNKN